ncbi:MAG: hypothetical protein HY364_05215 [Candidatus Aenigmarchaeota archaeon]|nr:hypothetical protein [Candidatus Aenigmarchaeota archaeon]
MVMYFDEVVKRFPGSLTRLEGLSEIGYSPLTLNENRDAKLAERNKQLAEIFKILDVEHVECLYNGGEEIAIQFRAGSPLRRPVRHGNYGGSYFGFNLDRFDSLVSGIKEAGLDCDIRVHQPDSDGGQEVAEIAVKSEGDSGYDIIRRGTLSELHVDPDHPNPKGVPPGDYYIHETGNTEKVLVELSPPRCFLGVELGGRKVNEVEEPLYELRRRLPQLATIYARPDGTIRVSRDQLHNPDIRKALDYVAKTLFDVDTNPGVKSNFYANSDARNLANAV